LGEQLLDVTTIYGWIDPSSAFRFTPHPLSLTTAFALGHMIHVLGHSYTLIQKDTQRERSSAVMNDINYFRQKSSNEFTFFGQKHQVSCRGSCTEDWLLRSLTSGTGTNVLVKSSQTLCLEVHHDFY
jgi:hypothetical protein